MLLLDLTLDKPELNLALDEALLESAEANDTHPEVLRFWEPDQPFVVLGRSSPIETEVNLDFCRQNSIPVLRRNSGGATVVSGPGCLMYCLLLSYDTRPELRMLDQAHDFVMNKMAAAVTSLGIECQTKGICDLTVKGQKVSGNSLRCKRRHFIYHGTFLYQLDPELIANCLRTPVRQPEYRKNREHIDFLTTLEVEGDVLREAIRIHWQAGDPFVNWPKYETRELARTRYLTESWINCR